jgi:hypothetical protein
VVVFGHSHKGAFFPSRPFDASFFHRMKGASSDTSTAHYSEFRACPLQLSLYVQKSGGVFILRRNHSFLATRLSN